MVHWTQESLRINRKVTEDLVDAYMETNDSISDIDHAKLMFEITMRCACSEKKAREYYAYVIRKKRLGL